MDPRKRVRDRVWARQRIRALDLHVPAPKSGKHGAVHRCLAHCVVQTTRPCRLTDIDDLAFLHIVQDGFSVGIFDVRLHRRLVGGACAHEARLQLAKECERVASTRIYHLHALNNVLELLRGDGRIKCTSLLMHGSIIS